MIHSISITNFQSIRDKITLNFRIPGTTPRKPFFRICDSFNNTRLPVVIVLAGANGSGKSTILRALSSTIYFACNSFGNTNVGGVKFIPFLDSSTRKKPTTVEIGFYVRLENGSNSRFKYVLQIDRGMTDEFVGYEALYAFTRNRRRRLFERRVGMPIYVAKEMELSLRDGRLTAIPPYASVMSTLSAMGVKSFENVVNEIRKIMFDVPAMGMSIAPSTTWSDSTVISRIYKEQPNLRDMALRELRRIDVGISGLEMIELRDGTPALHFKHFGVENSIPLSFESSGTRHFVHTYPYIKHSLDTGFPVFVDAIDTELHAVLISEVLSWYRRMDTNPKNAQLICTCQNLSILEDLEKEELFIVEKSIDGVTRTRGAKDFLGVRRDISLEKQYRSGSFGGQPAIG